MPKKVTGEYFDPEEDAEKMNDTLKPYQVPLPEKDHSQGIDFDRPFSVRNVSFARGHVVFPSPQDVQEARRRDKYGNTLPRAVDAEFLAHPWKFTPLLPGEEVEVPERFRGRFRTNPHVGGELMLIQTPSED